MDTEKQKKKVLHFRKGDEHRVVIEKEKYADSIFSEQYKQSLLIWNRICNDYTATGDVKSADENVHNVDGVSNIIAFCGDRGEGKTSCQMSFAELLHNEKERNEFLKQSKMDVTQACTKPFVMPLVDPLYFDQNHHLLDHVIGQLYSEIEETERNKEFLSKLKDNFAERKELLMQFQSVRRCLKQIENTCDDSYDELEDLSNRAASVRLHTEITLLFKRFLRYVKCDKLVIPIDDIDLNMSFGYQMVEDIRKYLCNPFCVLLLAVKIDQLTTVIQTRMMMDLQKIRNAEKRALPMAQKYVTKLLPYSNRVIMPTITDWAESDLACKFSEKDKERNLQIKNYVVNLIFDRTRYLFFNEKESISPIVPHSLRGLRQLLGMLEDMEPYSPRTGPEQNKQTFKDYFYNSWTTCLSDHDQQFVQRLVTHIDVVSINKLVVDYIKGRISIDDKDVELKDIIQDGNVAHNISVGDVFYLLENLSHTAPDEETKLLAFFLYSFYSIKLYDTYDEISDGADKLHPQFKRDGGNIDDDEISNSFEEYEVHKFDAWYQRTNKLQRFVNGSLFTYNLGDLLPKQDGKLARDRRFLRVEDLRADLDALKLILANGESLTDQEQKIFNRCELYVMFTKRFVSGNNRFDLRLDRRYLDPYYLAQYTQYTNFLEFDILAPFVNAINLAYSYWRFDNLLPGFYNAALLNKNSLLRKMMNVANDNKVANGFEDAEEADDNGKYELYLASNAIIRVSDVLVSLKERLKNRREANNKGQTDSILNNVMSTIRKSGIKLYNRGKKEERLYEIKFEFLEVLYEALIDDDSLIKRLDNAMKEYEDYQAKKMGEKPGKKGAKQIVDKYESLTDKKLANQLKNKFGITGRLEGTITQDEWISLLRERNKKFFNLLGEEFLKSVPAPYGAKRLSYEALFKAIILNNRLTVVNALKNWEKNA